MVTGRARRIRARGGALVVWMMAALAGCRAEPAAVVSPNASASADPNAGCTPGLGERAATLPHALRDSPTVYLTLPAGIREDDLLRPLKSPVLPPRFTATTTLHGKRFAAGCGRTISQMIVGAVDDINTEEMPEFVATVLREDLGYPVGALEQVEVRGRSLGAVVRGAGRGSEPLWVRFTRPEDSCKVFFVVLAAPEADFAALLPVFQAVTRSLRIGESRWHCRPRGGGGGFG